MNLTPNDCVRCQRFAARVRANKLLRAALLLLLAAAMASAQMANWTQQSAQTSPSVRDDVAMAYDSAHEQVVIFGGTNGGSTPLNETWVWDGATWTQKSPQKSPPARSSAVMVYDEAHNQAVLFGGYGSTYLGDTWVWDGTNWTQKSPQNSPSARYLVAMAYDSVHGQVVLFGGLGGSGYLNDTWVWDGTNWTQKTSQTAPPARCNFAMTYDWLNEQAVMFGGHSSGTYRNDTWVWDGTNWTQKSPQNTPPGRASFVMAYDGKLGATVVFGGNNGSSSFGDTWMWDGVNWIQASSQPSPSARTGSAMVFDFENNQLVLFAGDDSTGYLSDVWLWGPAGPGSMAQIASAGGWDSALTVVNLVASPAQLETDFYGDGGSPATLPFTLPQLPNSSYLTSSMSTTLDAHATYILDTTGPLSQTTITGSSQLSVSGDLGAFAIFTYTPSGQAAVVPLETRNASSYLLAFDNTGSIATGLAIANVASNPASINVIVRDDTGAKIGSGSVNLSAYGHNSFMLTDSKQGFPATAGKRGTVEYDTPSGGQISVLGLRANGAALTTLPVLAEVGASGGTFAHIASGGGWTTSFTLVNTGPTSASVTLNFFGDNGQAVNMPVSFPQAAFPGLYVQENSCTKTIAAGASLLVNLQDTGTGVTTTGSAVLNTSGNIGGFAVFRYNTSGQEAVVPMQMPNAQSYILAFDNTGTLVTGLAVANAANSAANVGIVLRDDTGAQIGTGTINLPALGHASFMLTDTSSGWPATAGKRGTVEFDTPSGGQIAPLGLRAATITGGFTITTVPVMIP